MSKKEKGSSNRNKARQKVAHLHAKIANSRLDALHKASRKLINENQVVCVESLAVKNMIKNHKLSKHIAEWGGRELVKIDQWFPSSKRYSCCGYTMSKLPLDIRLWECPECHAQHDRDLKAAINIEIVGRAGSSQNKRVFNAPESKKLVTQRSQIL